MLAIDVDESRIDFRLRTGYVDKKAHTLDEALEIVQTAAKEGRAVSVGLLANAADIYPELVSRGITPDVVTDQTSAHDPLHGYLPQGWTLEQYAERQESDPKGTVAAAKESMGVHVRAMLELQKRGAATLDYGNNIRQMALEVGVEDAFDFLGDDRVNERPELVDAMVSDELLACASDYLGAVPVLRRVAIGYSPGQVDTDHAWAGSQLFHYDGEDDRQVKRFVLLTDVEDERHGPLTFLSAAAFL